MISKKRIAVAVVLLGVLLAALVGPVAPFRANAGNKRTYRCMHDFLSSVTTVHINVHNPSADDIVVKYRYRNGSGVVTHSAQTSIPPRGTTVIGGSGTENDAVVELVSAAKLLLDGFIYHPHPLDDAADHLRTVTCY